MTADYTENRHAGRQQCVVVTLLQEISPKTETNYLPFMFLLSLCENKWWMYSLLRHKVDYEQIKKILKN